MSVPSASAVRLVWPSAVPIAGVSWCGGLDVREVPSSDSLYLPPVHQVVTRGERAQPTGAFASPLGVNTHPIQFFLTQLPVKPKVPPPESLKLPQQVF